eukprot:c21538_g2_i1 orf=575-796(+)
MKRDLGMCTEACVRGTHSLSCYFFQRQAIGRWEVSPVVQYLTNSFETTKGVCLSAPNREPFTRHFVTFLISDL